MTHWLNRNVAILGYGISGRASASYLKKRGAHVIAADKKITVIHEEDGVVLHPDDGKFPLEGVDCLIISPGVPQSHPICRRAAELGIKVLGEIEVGFEEFQGAVLAVTGTNGKTTVTSLVEHVLNSQGISCRAVGNIGRPLTEEIDQLPSDCCLVVELSSYQLEVLKNQVIDAAVLLNITPDHLDRYGTMDAYAAAKFNIANCLRPGGKFFVHQDVIREFSKFATRDYSIYHDENPFGALISQFPKFEQENILAAYALCKQKGITPKGFLGSLSTFKKPEHRLAFVAEKNGVKFYNDSKGTNLDAAIKAVESMDGTTIMIVGGVDKGGDYSYWIEAFKDKVRFLCVIGQASDEIIRTLGNLFPYRHFSSLAEATEYAFKEAKPGENVLLSPGCASFDQFKDYRERGRSLRSV